MKISFFESNRDNESYLKSGLKKIKGVNVEFFKTPINSLNAIKAKNSDVLVVFVDSCVDKEVLDKMPNLNHIVTMSTGYDHIDINECKRRKISVSNVPHYGENTVAEHTFGLILSISRKIPVAVERTKKDDFSLEGLEGFDLRGKTLGVIGPGSIGQRVIKIAKGFEMEVIAFAKTKDFKLSRELGFKYVDFDNLLRNSDIITIHVPLLPSTRGMINMSNIKKIKKGCFIINAARGEIIDTTALLYGLEKKIISGAALDVLEGEEDIKDEMQMFSEEFNKEDMKIFMENHRLLKEKNVIVTPHMAFFTREAIHRILDTTIENILSFKKGRIVNRVDR